MRLVNNAEVCARSPACHTLPTPFRTRSRNRRVCNTPGKANEETNEKCTRSNGGKPSWVLTQTKHLYQSLHDDDDDDDDDDETLGDSC